MFRVYLVSGEHFIVKDDVAGWVDIMGAYMAWCNGSGKYIYACANPADPRRIDCVIDLRQVAAICQLSPSAPV